jgi:hypothetical protein
MLDAGTFVPDHFVLAALIAGLRTSPKDYLYISASMAKGERPGGRHAGARALGLMPLMDDASVAHALEALRSIIEDRNLDTQVRANALSAAVNIAVRVPAPPPEQFLDLLRQAPSTLDSSRHARRPSDSMRLGSPPHSSNAFGRYCPNWVWRGIGIFCSATSRAEGGYGCN